MMLYNGKQNCLVYSPATDRKRESGHESTAFLRPQEYPDQGSGNNLFAVYIR